MISQIGNFVNEPLIKEGIKDVAGSVTFIFGAYALYDLSQSLLTAKKVNALFAKISLIMSAVVSRPVIHVFSYFEMKSSTFQQNPWHPRHVISIAAVILAIPCIVFGNFSGKNRKIRWMLIFNTITSRPVLHIGNQIFHLIYK